MSNIRKALLGALSVNEAHVEQSRYTTAALTEDEKSLLESLRSHPVFGSYPKDQLDRHTIKGLLVAISDQPVSVCESAASKAERLILKGILSENLTMVRGGKTLTEAEEVPVEKPEIPDGDGELEQGPADTCAAEHDGADVGKAAKGAPSGAADQGTDQDKDKHGDKADVAKSEKDGYKQEESADVEHGHDEDDSFKLESEDDDADDLDEDDDADDLDEDDDEDDVEESEEVAKDAPDVSDAEHRAANDATYKDGKKQNEARRRKMKEQDAAPPPPAAPAPAAAPAPVKPMESEDDDADDLREDDLSRDDETKDASDLPDLDKVQKEDPAKSELDKGPADPKLESLDKVEKRICSILREAGIKKGSRRWNEAYVRGWSLAMEHRAKRITEGK